MVYGAVLENESGFFWKGIKVWYPFENEDQYRDFVDKRQYMKTVKAPATLQEFLEMIGAKSLDEFVPLKRRF